jgi:hypothetical protein
MIGIMVDENAKQIGQNSAAVLDSVCAAIRRIAYLTLTADAEVSTIVETVPQGTARIGCGR